MISRNNSVSNEELERMIPNGSSHKLAVAWIDLSYHTRNLFGKNPVQLLNNLSGSADFGKLIGLMGPSGAGKSTLLKCINGTNMYGTDSSTELYMNPDIRSCFVVQNISEHLLSGLTAIQSLIYASKLKNCETHIDHKQNARDLLSILDMIDIENTSVEKCSGGQQKRLAIALELTTKRKPNLLCIDEPTTGLDSNAAELVIQTLRGVAQNYNIAVITSIHQPNNDLVMMFDNLYVLAKGGICVYDGPPQKLRQYLSSSQIECNQNQVPIEILMKTCSKTDGSPQRLAVIILQKRNSLKQRSQIEGQLSPKGVPQKRATLNLKHMWYLFCRESTRARHQWKSYVFRFVLVLSAALLMSECYDKHIGEADGCDELSSYGLMSNQTCLRKRESFVVQNQKYLLFEHLMIQFLSAFTTILIFSTEVNVFLNQIRNGWFSTGSYYWTKSLFVLPLSLLISLCYSFIALKSTHQISDSFRFWASYGLFTVGSLVTEGLGLVIGIIGNTNDKMSSILVVGIFLYNVFLSGLLVSTSEIPSGLQWINTLSFTKCTVEMQMVIIYGFDRCPNGQTSLILCQLDLLNMDKFWFNAYSLITFGISLRILALIFLLIKSKSSFI